MFSSESVPKAEEIVEAVVTGCSACVKVMLVHSLINPFILYEFRKFSLRS